MIASYKVNKTHALVARWLLTRDSNDRAESQFTQDEGMVKEAETRRG